MSKDSRHPLRVFDMCLDSAELCAFHETDDPFPVRRLFESFTSQDKERADEIWLEVKKAFQLALKQEDK